MTKESLRRGEKKGKTQITKRDDNKVFKNPLKVALTVIGSLRHVFVSCCDTTALT